MKKICHVTLLLCITLGLSRFVCEIYAQLEDTQPRIEVRSAKEDKRVQKILREKHNLFLDDFTIVEILRKAATITGVGIEADDEALALLPNGEQTRISAKVRDTPIGDALTEVLSAVGLEYNVREGKIKVDASADLKQFGRKVTWEELKFIGALNKRIDVDLPDVTFSDALKNLAELSGAKLTLGEGVKDQSTKQRKVKLQARRVTLKQALDLLCQQVGLSWTTRDNVVLLNTPQSIAQTEAEIKLRKKVQLDYSAATVSEILSKLESTAGVEIEIDPGALGLLPDGTNTRLSLKSDKKVSLGRAFEFIQSMTGLTFSIKNGKIVLAASEAMKQSAKRLPAPVRHDDKVVGKIVLWSEDHSTSLEIFIYETELPSELRKLKEEKLKEFVDILRARRKAEESKDKGE